MWNIKINYERKEERKSFIYRGKKRGLINCIVARINIRDPLVDSR